jgi:NAD(P)H-dependent FMN reductase
MTPLKIHIILGSTRPNRFGDTPAQWILRETQKLPDVQATLIDLRDHPLPFYDRPISPSMSKPGDYGEDTANAWAKIIAEADGYIFVSPEYNHGYSAVLKNALDTIYHEWNRKAVAFVGYGSVGGARSVEQLRQVAVELQMAPVRQAVHIPWSIMGPIAMGKAEWTAETEEQFKGSLAGMLENLVWWTKALKTARAS